MFTKECKSCGRSLSTAMYWRRSAEPDGLNRHCTDCVKAKKLAYRQANREALASDTRKRQLDKLQERTNALMAQTLGICSMCNNQYKWLYLDLDHIDPTKKTGNPAQLIRNASDARWLSELKNLRVICGRCHRKHTRSGSGVGSSSPSRKRRRAMIDAIKTSAGCLDCGWNEWPEALDFDHVPERGEKLFTIGNNFDVALEKLNAEIAKCEIRCVHCHRDQTSRRGVSQKPF